MTTAAKGAAKTRRLLELYLYLTNVKVPVGRDRVRANVEGYGGLSDEAFERQFERDKRDFRRLGIEIETTAEEGTEIPARYRIVPRRSALPRVEFTPEEMAALQVARNMWHQMDLFAEASGAVRKLVHEDVVLDDTPLVGLSPRAAGPEPTFEDLRGALRARSAVSFRYRTATGSQAALRRVQPWQLVMRHGASYLRGHDLDRGAERVFRLSRIVGEVHRTGPGGSYDIPDLAALGPVLEEPGELTVPETVTVAVAPGRAQALRLSGTPGDASTPVTLPGWDVLDVRTRRPQELVDTVVGYGPDVVVLMPSDVREHVMERLRAVAGGRR